MMATEQAGSCSTKRNRRRFLWLLLVSTSWTGVTSDHKDDTTSSSHVHLSVEAEVDTPSTVSHSHANNQTLTNPFVYTPFDDFSWAVSSPHLSHPEHQARYDKFMQECVDLDPHCRSTEDARLHMNVRQPPAVINYTSTGFRKIRAPPALFQLLSDFWEANKGREVLESDDVSPFQNTWEVPTSLLKTELDHFIGGGWNLSAAVWNAARDILEDWTGQTLAGSSVYGIRLYHNQSILTPHVDRLPLVSSAIINVAQDVEEDWVLEVYGHDGKATNVTMLPGDMVLYESHSVIHGRPFPLKGKYYANIFVHFEPMGDKDSTEPLPEPGSLPPYLIPESDWAQETYVDRFPQGWTLLQDLELLARRGDLYTLQYVAQRDSSVLHADTTLPGKQCRLLLAAMRTRQISVVDYFVTQLGYNMNMVCSARTPLDSAERQFEDHDDPMVEYLRSNGALHYTDLIAQHPEQEQVADDRCDVLRLVVFRYNGGSLVWDEEEEEEILLAAQDLMAFLFEVLEYDLNMVCPDYSRSSPKQRQTPKDVRRTFYDHPDHQVPNDDDEMLHVHDYIWSYLLHNNAQTRNDLKDANEEETALSSDDLLSDYRCNVMQAAIYERMEFPSTSALFVLEFLIDMLNYNVNMVCESDNEDEEEEEEWYATPLDWAWDYWYVDADVEDPEILDQGDAVVAFLKERGARTYEEIDERPQVSHPHHLDVPTRNLDQSADEL